MSDLKIELETLVDEARERIGRLHSIQSRVSSANLLKKAALAEEAAAESVQLLDSLTEAVATLVGAIEDD